MGVSWLERWPSLPDVQRAKRDTVSDFFHAHNVRRANTIEERIAAIKSEKPLTTDLAVIQPALLLVETLLPQLRTLSAGIVRFDEEIATAAALQMLTGIAPVTERSGKRHWVHWRWACPKFLRQTFVEWAASSIPHSFWARAFYESQKAKGSTHNAAVRALAFKWIRVLFR